jgi:hypothetical protein
VFGVILCVIGFCVAYVLIKMWLWLIRAIFPSHNKYIAQHHRKLVNDSAYNKYLKWCELYGEIPMNKEVYLKDVEAKEKEIKNLI